MSDHNPADPSLRDFAPIDLRQDRRQWLFTSAAALGATLLPAAAMTAETPQSKTAPAPPQAKPSHPPSAVRFFTPAQHALVEELSETIIPADPHSGGAKAAKVADYIDQVLRTGFDENRKALWREGLHLIEVMNHHYHGKSFVDSPLEQRVATLSVLSENEHMTDLPEVRLYVDLKRLTVEGYYTSRTGIHDELQYKGNRILREFVGCGDPTPPSS